MKTFQILFLSAVSLLLAACSQQIAVTTMTPLEIQSIQLRTFDVQKSVVFPSVVSVFQDLGYTITSADLETGIISAESAATNNPGYNFWFGVAIVKQTKATAFIEQISDQTNVRLNFVEQRNSSSGNGQSDRKDTPLYHAEVYQSAFEKIENAIFVRSG
jgi:hypothetical protein